MTHAERQARYWRKHRDNPEFKARRAALWKQWADKNREHLKERDWIRTRLRDWAAEYRRNPEGRKAAVKRSRQKYWKKYQHYDRLRYRLRKARGEFD